jgi:hypothetical protein
VKEFVAGGGGLIYCANGQGFEILKKDIKVPVGEKEHTETIELPPMTGMAVSVQ